jgi:hypothetical protein
MQRAPATILAATLLGAIVGLGLATNGLWARLSGVFVEGGWAGTMWSAIPETLRFDPGAWALTVVTLGILWWGAFGAIWSRVSWGHPAALIVAVLSLAFFPLGTILSAIVLLLLLLPSSRAWWALATGHDGG